MPNIELWVVSWLLDVSIKVALLAAGGWAFMAASRLRSNTVKHRVWLLLLVGILLLPALVKLTPAVPLPGGSHPTLPSLGTVSDESAAQHSGVECQPTVARWPMPVDSRPPLARTADERQLPAPARAASVAPVVQEPVASEAAPLSQPRAAPVTPPQIARVITSPGLWWAFISQAWRCWRSDC